MPTSVKSIIDQSLRKLGRLGTGEQADPNEYADGLQALRMMLDAWSLEPLMVPFSVTEAFDLDPAKAQYSMGTGGDWDTVRPEEIQYVRVVDAGGIARPVKPSSMALLQYQGFVAPGTPAHYLVSQDARFLNVEFDCYPIEPLVWVTSRKPFNVAALDNFDTLFEEGATPETPAPSGFTLTGVLSPLEFPTGYEAAIVYNLTVHLAPEYPGLALSEAVVALAGSTKRAIKRGNWRPADLRPDVSILRRGRYDINQGPY